MGYHHKISETITRYPHERPIKLEQNDKVTVPNPLRNRFPGNAICQFASLQLNKNESIVKDSFVLVRSSPSLKPINHILTPWFI
ncbi:hypothetical protein VP01_15666g1 [Puccinia sorghi]|uniref:Uncharacterized protein n=1 Tax=Puccinia sorghi TaxID=27349 RepID=A0A0L6VHZ1_9BASI|nr:hypothetical protein VP01_15666g1 [Puccinia sorghi]